MFILNDIFFRIKVPFN